MRSDKSFIYSKSMDLGMRHWSLRNRPMVQFILLNTSLRCSSNDNRLSSIIPRYFCDVTWCNYNVIKGQRGVTILIYFLSENNLLSLFIRILNLFSTLFIPLRLSHVDISLSTKQNQQNWGVALCGLIWKNNSKIIMTQKFFIWINHFLRKKRSISLQ